jgi:hypothetical protein
MDVSEISTRNWYVKTRSATERFVRSVGESKDSPFSSLGLIDGHDVVVRQNVISDHVRGTLPPYFFAKCSIYLT